MIDKRLIESCWRLRHEHGYSIEALTVLYGVSQRTVYYWLSRHDRPPVVRVPQRPGRKPKCSHAVEQAVCEFMTEDIARRQLDAVAMAFERFGVRICQKTVSNILRRHDITRKAITYSFTEQEGWEPEVAAFQEVIRALPRESWAAMDESGFYLNESLRFRYSKRGTPVVADRPKGRGDHYVLFLCIRYTPKGASVRDAVVSWVVHKGYANAQCFQPFLADGIGSASNCATLAANGASVMNLALDNVRIHNATHACRANGLLTITETAYTANVNLRFTAKYCPFLNPTELAFKIIKEDYVRRIHPRTRTQLVEAIARGIQALTPEKVNAMFEHSFLRANLVRPPARPAVPTAAPLIHVPPLAEVEECSRVQNIVTCLDRAAKRLISETDHLPHVPAQWLRTRPSFHNHRERGWSNGMDVTTCRLAIAQAPLRQPRITPTQVTRPFARRRPRLPRLSSIIHHR